MKSWIYLAGRIFQLMGLIAMPSAIWAGHFGRDEQGAIAIFTASILVFSVGVLLNKIAKG